jgi:hypothetical protein
MDLYDVTVPGFVRGLKNLRAFLEKGRAWAEAQGLDESALTGARLFDDMAPLTAQVQRVSDTAKGVCVRVGGAANVPFADEEASFADLFGRIDRTIAFLDGVDRAGFAGRDEALVQLPTPNGAIDFTGASYVQNFAVPNFWFHVTTAYAILRAQGVPVGKMDFLGAR